MREVGAPSRVLRSSPLQAFALATGLLVFFATVGARTAGASPEDVLGYGNRSPAMGGTGVAYSEGFEAAYTNPALVSRLRQMKLTLGFEAATFSLSANGPGAPGEVPYDSMRGYVIGADFPVPLGGVLKNRIGLALAFSTPTNVIVRGQIRYPEVPQFSLLPDRTQSLAIRAALGIDVGWGIRVGVGFAALADLDGSAVVQSDATSHVSANVQDQLVASYAPTVGLSYELPLRSHNWLRVGAVYRGALAGKFDVTIDATKLSSLNLPLLTIAGLAQYDPEEVALEIATKQGGLMVALGATFKHWSAYPGLLEPTVSCTAADPSCGAIVPPAISYSNTVVPRLGGEYTLEASRALDVHLRAGVFYERSPLPSKLPPSMSFDASSLADVSVPTRYYDADRLAVSLGYGVTLKGPLPPIDVDLFGQAHALLPRTIESDGQTKSVAQVSGTVLAGGLLAGVKF
jgi:long-chain fatty acid transport protein